MGIMWGQKCIDEKWIKPLGNKIKTFCINLGDRGITIPETVHELTDRILKLAPCILGGDICDTINSENGYTINIPDSEKMIQGEDIFNIWYSWSFDKRLRECPFVVRIETPIFDVFVDYGKEPYLKSGEPFILKIEVENKIFTQQWLTIKLHLPVGLFSVNGEKISVPLEQYHCNIGRCEVQFEINSNELVESIYEIILEVSSLGHHTKGLIPISLFKKMQTGKNLINS